MEEEDVLKLLFDDDHNSNDLELVDEELERELLEEDDHDNLIHKTSESSRSQASGSSRSRVSSPAGDNKIEVKPRSPAQQLAKHDDNERKTKISTDDLYHPLSEESIKRARLNVKNRRNHPTSSESRKNNRIEFNNRMSVPNSNFLPDRKPLLPNIPSLLGSALPFNSGNNNSNINGNKFMPSKVPLTLRPMPSASDGNANLFFPPSAPKPPLLQHMPHNNFPPSINLAQINPQLVNLPLNMNSANGNFKQPLLASFPGQLNQMSSFQNTNSLLLNQNDSQYSPTLSNSQSFFNKIQQGMPPFNDSFMSNSIPPQLPANMIERNMPIMGSSFMNSNIINTNMNSPQSQFFTANQLPSNFNLQQFFNKSSGSNANIFENNASSQSRGNFSNNVTIPILNEPLLVPNNMRENIGKRLGRNPHAQQPLLPNNSQNSTERHVNVNNVVQIQTQHQPMERFGQNQKQPQRPMNSSNNSRKAQIMSPIQNATTSQKSNGSGQGARPMLSQTELRKPLIAETPIFDALVVEKAKLQPVKQKKPLSARLEPKVETKVEPKVEPTVVVNTETPVQPGTIAVQKIKEVLGINEELIKKKNEIKSLREKMEKLKAAKRKVPPEETPKKAVVETLKPAATASTSAPPASTTKVANKVPLPKQTVNTSPTKHLTCALQSKQAQPSPQKERSDGYVFCIQAIPSKPSSQPPATVAQTKPSTKVKITGLSVNTRESAIRKISRPCGMVQSISFEEDAATGERFAIVEFEQVAHAQKFLDTCQQQQIDSCLITLSFVNWFVHSFPMTMMMNMPTDLLLLLAPAVVLYRAALRLSTSIYPLFLFRLLPPPLSPKEKNKIAIFTTTRRYRPSSLCHNINCKVGSC